MINNIISYAKEYGRQTFSQMPFNEVDALLLCQLSYLNYKDFVGSFEDESVPLPISNIYYDPEREKIFDGYWYRDENRELFETVVNSTRYGSMKLYGYTDLEITEEDTVFSAVTFLISKDHDFVAFRGTGADLTGWKEDMKLAYSRPVGAQKLAAAYLETALSKVNGNLSVGGHSKGGNLAVYAAMCCPEEERERILTVYDNDGPGFRPELIDNDGYRAVKDKIRKFIPRSSAVGVILENTGRYEVVDCWGVGNLQHNTYTWKSENGSFLRSKDMKLSKKTRDAALNDWILSLTEDEIATFIDTLYDTITASDAKSVYDLKADLSGSLKGSIHYVKELDVDTKKALQKIIISFKDKYGDYAAEEVVRVKRSFRNEMESLYLGAASLLSRKKDSE